MKYITLAVGLFILAVISLLHVMQFIPIINYTITFVAASVLFLGFAFLLNRTPVDTKMLIVLLCAGFIVRLSFIEMTPIGSDDMYRYMWDGKVQAHSINPYQFAPADSALSGLSSPILPTLVKYPKMKTIYFPVSEWMFYFGYQLSGESVWGYKLFLLLCEIATIFGLFLLLTKLSIDRKYILLALLCPMMLYEYAIDGHVDGFGLPLMIFAVYFIISERRLLGLLMLGLSLSVKPTALILIPVFFFSEKTWKNKLAVVSIPLALLAVAVIPYSLNANPFESLQSFTVNWTFNGFIFNTLDSVIHNNQITRSLCAFFLGTSVIALGMTRWPLIDKIYYAVLLLLLFSPIVHPWYVGWFAVLLPLARKWSGIIFVSTLSLTSFTYISYQLLGTWKEEPIQWIAEYLPVVLCVLWEMKHQKTESFIPSM